MNPLIYSSRFIIFNSYATYLWPKLFSKHVRVLILPPPSRAGSSVSHPEALSSLAAVGFPSKLSVQADWYQLSILNVWSTPGTSKPRPVGFHFGKGIWEQLSRLPKKSSLFSFFWYICDSILSQHKHITCKFSNGLYRVVIIYSTKKSNYVSLLDFNNSYLNKENIPRFTIIPVNKDFQGCSTGRVNFHQKSLTNTLRTH